ncbi:Fc.00g013300.m01.CDS01 [Cosmosporella sp. VM-42]
MKPNAVFALFATAVIGQDLSELPPCAVPCFVDNFGASGCQDTTDFACLCVSDAYISAVTACVATSCDSDDISATLAWATKTCEEADSPLRRK